MDNIYVSYDINNLKELVENSVKLYKKKILYNLNDKVISFLDAYNYINRLGSSLYNLKLNNKKIGIISENRYEWEITALTVVIGGGVIVPLDKESTKEEIQNVIKKTNIEVIFCSKKYLNTLMDINTKEKNKIKIISFDIHDSKNKVIFFNDLIKEGEKLINSGYKAFIDCKVNSSECAYILFTSGTTQNSKAVMLSQKNICSNLNNMAKIVDLSSDDNVLSILPLNHVLEGIFSFLLSIYKGATRSYCENIYNIFEDIKKYNITYIPAVPAVYEYMYQNIKMDNKKMEYIKNIKTFFCAGAKLKDSLKEKYKSIGIDLVQGYGLTETSTAISLEIKKSLKPQTVGKVIDGMKLDIIDKDENNIGEIIVKGKNIMLGYYKDIENTSKVLKDGWFYTGDLGKLDNEGYIYIYGRKKDLIVLDNGKKVFPSEIEEKINNLKYVEESFVFEYNDKIYAKIVYSKNKFDNKEAEIDDYLKNQIKKINNNLPIYKRINKCIFSTNPLAKTTSFKINRNFEKKEALDELNKELNIEDLKIKEQLAENGKNIAYSCIKNVLDIDIKNIKDEYRLKYDLNADSLDIAEIKLNIEKILNIKINNESFKKVVTVKDLIECINKTS